jgi:copper chaperone CopZ
MHCDDCAGRVETALHKLPGVITVTVDLVSEKANLTIDPAKVDLFEFRRVVEGAGYSIPASVIALRIEGMHCLSCVSHVQGALEDLVGVFSATVDLAKGTAIVTHVQGVVSPSEMEKSVRQVGYSARLIDAEKVALSNGEGVDPSVEQHLPRTNGWIKQLFRRA